MITQFPGIPPVSRLSLLSGLPWAIAIAVALWVGLILIGINLAVHL